MFQISSRKHYNVKHKFDDHLECFYSRTATHFYVKLLTAQYAFLKTGKQSDSLRGLHYLKNINVGQIILVNSLPHLNLSFCVNSIGAYIFGTCRI